MKGRYFVIPLFTMVLTSCMGAKLEQVRIGIEITEAEFDKKVEFGISLMSSKKEITTKNYILLVRISNTIASDTDEGQKTIYDNFMKLFSDHVQNAVEKLKASLSLGMAYHSDKYDIWIGGQPHANSKFKVIKKN